jgi:hypothetical protein
MFDEVYKTQKKEYVIPVRLPKQCVGRNVVIGNPEKGKIQDLNARLPACVPTCAPLTAGRPNTLQPVLGFGGQVGRQEIYGHDKYGACRDDIYKNCASR